VLTLRVGGQVFRAGEGDVLWIPRGTALVYEAAEKVVFFYAVYPAGRSPSTSETAVFPTAPSG
jgi:ethanolamine utilization protein EutQ (cupin superfamily)